VSRCVGFPLIVSRCVGFPLIVSRCVGFPLIVSRCVGFPLIVSRCVGFPLIVSRCVGFPLIVSRCDQWGYSSQYSTRLFVLALLRFSLVCWCFVRNICRWLPGRIWRRNSRLIFKREIAPSLTRELSARRSLAYICSATINNTALGCVVSVVRCQWYSNIQILPTGNCDRTLGRAPHPQDTRLVLNLLLVYSTVAIEFNFMTLVQTVDLIQKIHLRNTNKKPTFKWKHLALWS
jgi:hypothetical protein